LRRPLSAHWPRKPEPAEEVLIAGWPRGPLLERAPWLFVDRVPSPLRILYGHGCLGCRGLRVVSTESGPLGSSWMGWSLPLPLSASASLPFYRFSRLSCCRGYLKRLILQSLAPIHPVGVAARPPRAVKALSESLSAPARLVFSIALRCPPLGLQKANVP
jgi:hypothetical protein